MHYEVLRRIPPLILCLSAHINIPDFLLIYFRVCDSVGSKPGNSTFIPNNVKIGPESFSLFLRDGESKTGHPSLFFISTSYLRESCKGFYCQSLCHRYPLIGKKKKKTERKWTCYFGDEVENRRSKTNLTTDHVS